MQKLHAFRSSPRLIDAFRPLRLRLDRASISDPANDNRRDYAAAMMASDWPPAWML